MFEGIVNSLLEKYLAPYLDNMSASNLRFRLGKMSAKNLKLKSSLCALLGFDALELKVGELKVLEIEVPFFALLSGGVTVTLEKLEVDAVIQQADSKPGEQRLEELRKTRIDSVEHKAAQQIEVRKHQKVVEAAQQEGRDLDAGMVAKVARHFISNVRIQISDLSCRISDPESGAHVAAELGNLYAQAPTDEEREKATTTQTVEVTRSTSSFQPDDAHIAKAIGFRNFFIKGGFQVSSNIVSLHLLQVILLQNTGNMAVEIDFGLPGSSDSVTLSPEQITALMMVSNALGEESKRLHALLVPPGAEQMVNLTTKQGIKKADEEYVRLSTRYYRKELEGIVPSKRLQELTMAEEFRLKVLRDVVPLDMQAEWFMPVMQDLQEARRRDAKKHAGWPTKMLQTCTCWSEDSSQGDPGKMMKELHEEAEGLKDVVVPNNVNMELQIGTLVLRLDDATDTILNTTLKSVGLVAEVCQEVDHRGEQSADWKIDFVLQSFSITHHAADVLRFGTVNEKPAFKVAVDNRLEETRNVIALDIGMQPLELFFSDSVVQELRKLQSDITAATTPKTAVDSAALASAMAEVKRTGSKGSLAKSVQRKLEEKEDEEVLQSYYEMGKAWMETSSGQEMLEEAKKRKPDALEIRINIQAPRLYFPVRGKAAVHLSFGVLEVESNNLTPDSGELIVKLQPASREPVLAVVTTQGVKHPMISIKPLIATLAFNDAVARVVVQLESMEVDASPDLIQILATVPAVLQEALAIDEATHVEEVHEELASAARKANAAIAEKTKAAEKKTKEKAEVKVVKGKGAERKPTQILQAIVDIQNIGIMLSSDIDRSAPVLRLFLALRSVEICKQGSSISMPLETMALSAGAKGKQMMRLRADGFNLEVGRFEPILEPFELSCQMLQDEAAGTEVHLFARRPLLVNINPFTLRRLQWYSTRLAGSIVPMSTEPKAAPVRYALLNLSRVPIGLQSKLESLHGQVAWMDVAPTGQTWRCLDKLDFAFPPSISVSVANPQVHVSQRPSARLDLGLLNAVRIPNTDLMVQLLRPSVLGAVILVSQKVLIFNETSVPLALRFDASQPLVWTSCARSDIMDGSAHLVEEEKSAQSPGAVPSWLMPGAFASTPLELPPPSEEDDDDEDEEEDATVWEVMMKTQPNQWGKASLSYSSTFSCIQCGSHHVLAVVDYQQSSPPASEKLLSIKLLPPLQLTSCLPCKVEVQYYGDEEDAESARQVQLAETDTVQIYDISFPQTLRIRSRIIGGAWSTWAQLELNEEDIGEEDRLMSRLEAEMQVYTEDAGEYTLGLLDKGNGKVQLCCQTWLIDRTGWNLGVAREGPLIDAGGGVLLCGNNVKYHRITSNGRSGSDFSLPSGHDHTVTATPEGVLVTVRARPLEGQEEDIVRCLEIVPRIVVKNFTDETIEFRTGDDRAIVRAGEMQSPQFSAETMQFRTPRSASWSMDIPVTEEAAGTASIAVGTFCYTVDIRTEHGVVFFLITPGSKFALRNKLKESDCEIRVRSLNFHVPSGETCDFGWIDPFDKDKDMEVELILDDEDFQFNPRITYHKRLRGRLEICSCFEKTRHVLEVRERNAKEPSGAAVTLNVVFPRIGISLMGRPPRQVRISELLYFELALLQIVATTKPQQDRQTLHVALGDWQLDYQVVDNPKQHCVILGNRGASGGRLARSVLQLHAERCQISSSDVHLSTLSFQMDELEVTIDDTLITTLLGVVDVLMPPSSSKTAAGFAMSSVELVRKQAGQPLSGDYIPAPATIFQIDDLILSGISVKLWARIRLKRVKCMLPSWAVGLVGALCLSDSMSMDGANIALSPKYLKNLHGKAADLASGFVHEWMGNMLRSVASVLGHSSLMAIPLAPVELLDSAGTFATTHGPGTDIIDAMTMDPEYAAQHRHQRAQPIRGARDGFSTAISSFGQGVGGILDVFRRPVQGAKKDGVKGFVKGVGSGIMSGVVKGVSGITDAALDIGRGFVAEVHKTINPSQSVVKRVRHPRATYGPIGAVVDFSELDAHVMAYIHQKADASCAIEAILPLFKWEQPKVEIDGLDDDEDHGPTFEALVITHDKILIARIPYQRLYVVEGFYPDVGYEKAHPNMVHTRFLQHLRVQHSTIQRGGFQIRNEIPLTAMVSVHFAQKATDGQKPPLLLETRTKENGKETLEVPMPWSICNELPQAACALLSSIESGVLPPKKVEVLQHILTTVRSSMQGDEMENKTLVDEECWEVQRAAVAAGFDSGWQLPFLPTEPEQQQGWLAEGMEKRHPLLDATRSTLERKKKGPPMRNLHFWKPNGTWQREINEHTDGDGWQYGTNWSSKHWRASPMMVLDVVRRRKWTIKYTLNYVGQMNSKVPSKSLPFSATASLEPSVTESMPPSQVTSAVPSPTGQRHVQIEDIPDKEPEVEKPKKPGTIAARQLHSLAANANLQRPLPLPIETGTSSRVLPYPRSYSVTSPSSVRSVSYVRSPLNAAAPTQTIRSVTPRAHAPQMAYQQRSLQGFQAAISSPVYRPQYSPNDMLAISRSSVSSRVSSASRPSVRHPSMIQRR